MKITGLIIENFLTVGNASLRLSDKGLVLLQGVNNDDASADSNGAGKSSVPDALCWALYGETARGVKGDAIINHTAKKGTMVQTMIEDGEDFYLVARHRKHKEHKNRLTIHVNGVDKTKGTDALTQQYIVDLLGCSVDVFRAAVYAGQEAMPDLPGMTDKQLKVLVEESAGIDKLQQAHEVAKDKLRKAKSVVDGVISNINTQKDRKEYQENAMLDSEEKRAEWDRGKKIRVEGLKTKVGVLKLRHDEAIAAVDKFDLPPVLDELDKTVANIAAVDEERAKLEELSKKANDAENEFNNAMRGVKELKFQQARAEKDLANVEHKIGESCGECGKEHTEDDVKELRQIAIRKIEAIKGTLAKELLKAKALRGASEIASDAVNSFKATMTDITTAVARERELRTILTDHKAAVVDSERAKKSLVETIAETKKAQTETNPWSDVIASQLAKAKEAVAELELLSKKADEANRNLKLHEDAAEVFGQTGVRAHILDSVTPFLNERTSHYLSALSDGNISADWTTLTTTTKGELREKFNIEVKNDKGAETFQGLSGGEKRKVRLSAAMALQDMVASRATKPIELFIADEVDHALDEAGLERLMGILNEKATERGTVLVISHNELSDWIRDHAVVTKEGGYSTVTGALSV